MRVVKPAFTPDAADAVFREIAVIKRNRRLCTLAQMIGIVSVTARNMQCQKRIAVMHAYRPGFAINTALPKKIRPDIYVPSDEDIRRLMAFVKGTDMELPIMLAAFGMMRRGEIYALSLDDFNGNTVHIHQNKVRAHDGSFHLKAPKTFSGDRFVELPPFVVKTIRKKGYVTNYLPDTITKNFEILLARNNITHYRFHDLRHFSASVRHTLVPDVYTMQAGGWASEAVLQGVYRHAMSDKEKEMSDKVNDYFSDKFKSI